MKEITIPYVKYVLGHKKEILLAGREIIKLLYEELNRSDFSVREVAYVKLLNEQSSTSICGKKRDMSDVLIRQKKIYQRQMQDLRSEMMYILDEEEVVNRIWICFSVLENPGKKYLEELYVYNNLYRYVENQSGVSHRTFELRRSQAMKRLMSLYYSRLTNKEIIQGVQPSKS